jgi:hypothetical protein
MHRLVEHLVSGKHKMERKEAVYEAQKHNMLKSKATQAESKE